MKTLFVFLLLLCPGVALASNFGDLPAVLPVFWLALIVSFFIAVSKASAPATERTDTDADAAPKKPGFDIGAFVLYQLLGVVLSVVLLVILWIFTL
ncbi:hypothetical protein ACQUQU_17630 [Thalassolituus sp. LLYu03]|uniref:hypothetical protein n=1 Tax=Thalassolituus sp. LLYu03 TaxID=3421656 RepID=UPI003D26FA0C